MSADRREPESTVETYELGHYEQMQLSLALAWVTDPDEPPQEPDLETLRSLAHIFQPFGTITITRKVQS